MTMSGHQDVTAELDPRRDQQEFGDSDPRLSRRTALRGAAAAGIAATALAATATPALAAARPARSGKPETTGSGAPGAEEGEAIVAHVRNARTGEIDVFRGTSQTRLHDPALAALLLRASR
jgi:anaerobic selenocysteine-containing dehydrogenase